jgi:hypothetical protein
MLVHSRMASSRPMSSLNTGHFPDVAATAAEATDEGGDKKRQPAIPIIEEEEEESELLKTEPKPPTFLRPPEKSRLVIIRNKHVYIIGFILFFLTIFAAALNIGISNSDDRQDANVENFWPEITPPTTIAKKEEPTVARTKSKPTTTTSSITSAKSVAIIETTRKIPTAAPRPPPRRSTFFTIPLNNEKIFTWKRQNHATVVEISNQTTLTTLNRSEIELWINRFDSCLRRGDPCSYTKHGRCTQSEPCNDYRMNRLTIYPNPFNSICYDKIVIPENPRLISVCFDSNHWISYALVGVPKMKLNRAELFAFYYLCKGVLSSNPISSHGNLFLAP